ncbi:alpha/beta hydrolase [Granulosicoccus sp.]|nr:alpha/beta hydrolase [Granulosicoccus sp.]
MATDTKVAADAITFSDCTIGTDGIQRQAGCATLDVLLDPDDPSQGVLGLSIARIESRRKSSNTDALTILAGGPGQSAIDTFPAIAFAFRHIMRDRDVILIDQRGTGGSTLLDCPETDETANLDGAVNLQTDPEELAQQAKACLDTLPADPTLFTTSVAVQDLESVRRQLGISQWNLYGVSYGTRVAMHYLRRYPDAVRTMILDAVVPPQISLGPDIGKLAQDSLEHIFARCESDTGCNEAFGNLTTPTLEFLDELAESPRSMTYEDIASGQLTTREFTRDHLAATLRLMSYSSQTAAILPSMLNEAINNDNLAPFARQADMQGASLSASLATGMHHAVICTEDVPFFAQDTQDTQALTSEQAQSAITTRSYLGDDIVSAITANCRYWPAGRIDDDFKEALKSDKPTLILSGGADPITPPEYGDMVAETLDDVKHIVNEAQGHMQSAFGCTPVLMAQFVDEAQTENLDSTCLERLSPTPFFIDANGPLP